jgi:hypothetical protein
MVDAIGCVGFLSSACSILHSSLLQTYTFMYQRVNSGPGMADSASIEPVAKSSNICYRIGTCAEWPIHMRKP